MNNLNFIGSSLMIFDLDSHLNPNIYKNNLFAKLEKKNERGKKISFAQRPTSIVNNRLELPPIK